MRVLAYMSNLYNPHFPTLITAKHYGRAESRNVKQVTFYNETIL